MEPVEPYAPPRSNLQAGADATFLPTAGRSGRPLRRAHAGRVARRCADPRRPRRRVRAGHWRRTERSRNVLGYLGPSACRSIRSCEWSRPGRRWARSGWASEIVRMDGSLVSFGGHLVRGILFASRVSSASSSSSAPTGVACTTWLPNPRWSSPRTGVRRRAGSSPGGWFGGGRGERPTAVHVFCRFSRPR